MQLILKSCVLVQLEKFKYPYYEQPGQNKKEHWRVISYNVAFWQVLTQTSLCILLLSLETQNDVRPVA